MKKLSLFTCAGLLFGLAACDSTSVQMLDDAPLGQTFVLTEGIPAPPYTPLAPPQKSDVDFHEAKVNGSTTTTVQIKPLETASVTIVYRITGRQGGDEWIRVNTVHSWDGTEWSSSNPVDFKVDGPRYTNANQFPAGCTTCTIADPQDIPVDISVIHNNDEIDGQEILDITPELVTHLYGSTVSPRLEINKEGGTHSTASLTVEFVAPEVVNQDPWITVTTNPLHVEAWETPPVNQVRKSVDPLATESIEAAVFANLTFGDPDDDPVTVTCSIAGSQIGPATALALGTYTVDCLATDGQGGSAQDSFELVVRDTTPPIFTLVPTGTEYVVATDVNGWSFDVDAFDIAASDVPTASPVSNPATVECTPTNGTQFAIGSTNDVSCTATDSVGNTSAPSTFNVYVTLDLSPVAGCGFGPPLRNDGPYSAHRRNSAIPHKLCAPNYANDVPATDLANGLSLVVALQGSHTSGEAETYEDPAAGSTSWRWVEADSHYIFNAKSTNQWSLGLWKTTVSYAGIELGHTYFELRR